MDILSRLRPKCQYPDYLIVGVVLSIIMHGLMLVGWGLKGEPTEIDGLRKEIFIELVSMDSQKKQLTQNQIVRGTKGLKPDFDIFGPLNSRSLRTVSTLSPDGLGPASDNHIQMTGLKNNVLKSIQKKISSFWHRASPPGVGYVELRLEIDTDGSVSSLWIKELHGTFQLAEFVSRLVYGSAPFVQAMRDMTDPMMIECIFHVSPRSIVKNELMSQKR